MTPVARFGLAALFSALAAGGVYLYFKKPAPAPVAPVAQVAPAPAAPAVAPVTTTAPTAPATPAAPGAFHVAKVAPPAVPLALSSKTITLGLDAYGAGMTLLELPGFNPHKGDTTPYLLSHTAKDTFGKSLANGYGAADITVDGTTLTLFNQAWSVSAQTQTAITLTATVQNTGNKPVLRIERTWSLAADRPYGIDLAQKIVNLDGKEHKVAFSQLAQNDVANDGAAYMGDGRKFALGYFSEKKDASRKEVQTHNGFVDRRSVAKDMAADEGAREEKYHSLWPWYDIESRADRQQNGKADTQLAWLGSYNRYFLLATHTPLAKDAKDASTLLALESRFPILRTLVKPHTLETGEKTEMAQSVQFLMETGAFELKGGESRDLSLGIYAGPRDANPLGTTGAYAAAGLNETVRFRLTEGFCGSCSFQWLAHLLLSYLNLLHSYITFDWGAAIIVLVLTVRLMLHPLTKKSQISMMRFGEQMKAIQPELEKIKAKYPGDKEKLSQETMRLYKEKGVNPANALGCLPMFLQMPIWAALYAMLYYAFPLRHESAFWGVFQHIEIGGHAWQFLSDLSSSDRFIVLFNDGQPHVFSLLFVQFDYSAINLLPLLMAVVMFINMKYTQTPATTDEQKMQQNMMKVMTLVMFPLMLYSAPCGLTLYITASTLAGIVDSMIVRRHINEMKANGTLLTNAPKTPPKPGSFRHRMQTRWEHIKAVAEAKRTGGPMPLTPEQQEALKKQNPFPRGPQSRWK